MTGEPFRPARGSQVTCPPDRGEPGYSGLVLDVGDDVQHNHKGAPFVWVTVRRLIHGKATRHVWPSNRLEARR